MAKVLSSVTEFDVTKMFVEHLVVGERDGRSAAREITGLAARCPEEGAELCRLMVDKAALACRAELGDEVEAVYVELTRAILTLLRQTRSSDEKVVEKAEIILDAFHLKTEFGIKTRETDFDGTSTISLGNRSTSAPTILTNFISDQIGRLRSDPDLIATTYNRLKRLCDLIR